jgi:hypothetical protein
MSEVSVEMVSRTMEALLTHEGRPIVYHDIATGADLPVSVKNAASARGLLPALVVAGEAVWREATGAGFALDIVRDRDAFLGFRLQAIGAGSLTSVMLATMEATAQVTGSGVVVVSDLNALWSAATERMEQNAFARPCTTPGASP